MRPRPLIYYTQTQKALTWERWKKVGSLQHIVLLFDRDHSSIQRILAETGGIRPPERHRSQLALTLAEREEISRAAVAGRSIRKTAALLAQAPSTISLEINRNRWCRLLPGNSSRAGGLGSGTSAHELPVGGETEIFRRRGWSASIAMVSLLKHRRFPMRVAGLTSCSSLLCLVAPGMHFCSDPVIDDNFKPTTEVAAFSLVPIHIDERSSLSRLSRGRCMR